MQAERLPRYWMYVRRAIPLYFSPKAKPELAYQLFRGAVEPTYPGTTWDNFFECMRILHSAVNTSDELLMLKRAP